MEISYDAISTLRCRISEYMSEKRYRHTLRVEEVASELFRLTVGDDDREIRCAALLHDIAKEISDEELILKLREMPGITADDLNCPAAYHALCGPFYIKRDFPSFAESRILSAVFNHTTGAPKMSLFDEIVFLADYIEPGRKYESCVLCREALYSELRLTESREERISAFHRATGRALGDTIKKLTEWGKQINKRTVLAYEYYIGAVNGEFNGK